MPEPTAPSTPDAVKELLAAQQQLLRAIEFDVAHGVSANQIARSCAPIASRPVVLDFIQVLERHAAIRAQLQAAGLDRYVATRLVGQFGHDRRRIEMTLGLDPAELDLDEPEALFARINSALGKIGIIARQDYTPVGHRRRANAAELGITVNPAPDPDAASAAFLDGQEFELIPA